MREHYTGIGERILHRMNVLNLKQTDLCNKTGLSSTAVSNYCTDKRTPDTASLYKLAQALETSMDWLFAGENKTIEELDAENPQTSNSAFLPSEHEAMFLGIFRLLPPLQQDEVFELVRFKYQYYVERKKESAFPSQNKNSSATA